VRYFVYPLHVSGSYLRLTSVSAALHLAHLRLLTRRCSAVPSLLQAAFKDTPYNTELEGPLASEVLGVENSHPDILACQLLLILMCLENGSSQVNRASVAELYMRYLTVVDHVSAACTLPESVELRLCEWTGELGRLSLVEARRKLLRCSDDSIKVPLPPVRVRAENFTLKDHLRTRFQDAGAFWRVWLRDLPQLVHVGCSRELITHSNRASKLAHYSRRLTRDTGRTQITMRKYPRLLLDVG
jgi:hypothetical protein